MTACTSFLAFFAEQTLTFAVKMHSRPDRWPQIVRFASGQGRFVGKPEVCQRFELPLHRGAFWLVALP